MLCLKFLLFCLALTRVAGKRCSEGNCAVWSNSPDRIIDIWMLFWFMFVQADSVDNDVFCVIRVGGSFSHEMLKHRSSSSRFLLSLFSCKLLTLT